MKLGMGYHQPVTSPGDATRSTHDHCGLVRHSSRTQIDVAVGVLLALRHCSQQQGFQCIADAVHTTGVGLGGVCHALISLVGGGVETQADPAAIQYWRRMTHQWAQASATHPDDVKARLGTEPPQ